MRTTNVTILGAAVAFFLAGCAGPPQGRLVRGGEGTMAAGATLGACLGDPPPTSAPRARDPKLPVPQVFQIWIVDGEGGVEARPSSQEVYPGDVVTWCSTGRRWRARFPRARRNPFGGIGGVTFEDRGRTRAGGTIFQQSTRKVTFKYDVGLKRSWPFGWRNRDPEIVVSPGETDFRGG